MKAYIIDYQQHAGKWIYIGYQNAFKQLGYDVVTYSNIGQIDKNDKDFILLTTDFYFEDSTSRPDEIREMYDIVNRSHKTYMHVQPHEYPMPWGTHPNYVSEVKLSEVEKLNQIDNLKLWTFSDGLEHFKFWHNVSTIPLAFDHISYQPINDDRFSKLDVCFVGGWADNGFNEKKRIMIDIFSRFMNSDLECGVFINKNISHEDECRILFNSKMCLNVHDAYQRILSYDCNERTYKSLGLNGLMVSDSNKQLSRLFPDIKTTLDADEMLQMTKDVLSLTEAERNDIKETNREVILNNHCYTHRIKQMLEL